MKLKSIKIEAFRAYNKAVKFDFSNENTKNLANLVLIYAPNGFGKTSFFDAIEWSFTGKIKRLEEYVRGNPKAKQLLLNKNSNKQNAELILSFENDTFLKRNTCSVANKNNDYDEGKYIQDDEKLQDNDKFKKEIKKSILSQDLISEFLRTTKPKERFDEFKIFWDYDDNSKLYEEIESKFTEIKKEKNELDKKLEKVEKDKKKIEKIILNNEKLQLKVDIYNKSVVDSKIKILKELDKVKNYKKFEDSTNSELEKIKNEKEEIAKKQKDYELILKEILQYQKDIEIKDKYKLSINRDEEVINLFNKLESYQEEKKNNLVIYNKYLKLNSLYDLHEIFEEKINRLEKYKQKVQNKLDLAKIEQKKKKELDDKITLIVESKTKLKNYLELVESVKKLEDSTININKTIEQKNDIKNILDKFFELDLEEYAFIDNDIKKEKIEYKKLLSLNEEKKKELTNISQDIINFSNFEKKYQVLINESLEHIKSNVVSDCPVCHTSFDTNEKLIEVILSKTPSNDTIKILKEKEKTLSESIKKIEQKIRMIHEKITQYISDKRNRLELTKIKLEYEEKKEELEGKIKVKDNLNTYMRKHNLIFRDNILYINNRNITEYEQELKKSLIKYQYQIELILKYENRVSKINNLMDRRKSIDSYKIVKELIKEEKIVNKNQVIAELSVLIDLLQRLNDNIEKIKHELGDSKLDKIKESLSKNKDSFNELEKSTQEFEKIYRKYSDKITKDIFEKLKINNLKNSEDINNLMTVLTEIRGVIYQNIKLEEIKSKITELDDKKKQIENQFDSLKEINESAKEFIDEKINEAFNLPLINDIYKKIEPHPEFDEISFETILKGKDSELQIKAKKNNKEEILPILYFSAAQINVLSLSIFLAKALQNSAPKLKTIFIDDPIQHLDSINILSFIDLMRIIIEQEKRQLIITTHDESFFNLVQKKMPSDIFNTKYLELVSVGKLK